MKKKSHLQPKCYICVVLGFVSLYKESVDGDFRLKKTVFKDLLVF